MLGSQVTLLPASQKCGYLKANVGQKSSNINSSNLSLTATVIFSRFQQCLNRALYLLSSRREDERISSGTLSGS